MSDRPILFLDVDGVINCYGLEGSVRVPTKICPVEVPAGTPQRVERLLAVFEPVWATAWRGAAHPELGGALGLQGPSWPYVDYADKKLPALIRYAKGRRWAFVDDDAGWELGTLHPHFAEIPGTLIVTPDASVGLTDEHVEQLLSFAGERSTHSP